MYIENRMESQPVVVNIDIIAPTRASLENCSRGNFSLSTCSTTAEYIGYIYIYTPIVMAGCLLNITNIVVFHYTKVKSKTMTYLMVLAVFDLLTLSIAVPLGITRCLPTDVSWEQWMRAIYEIYLFLPFANFFATVSIWTTVVMSIDRYIHVRQSKTAQIAHPVTTRCQRITILVIILGAAAINLPFVFYREIADNGQVRDSEFSKTTGFAIYKWIRFVVIKMVPIVLMVLANSLLVKVVVDMNRKRRSLVGPLPAKARWHQTQVYSKLKRHAKLPCVYIPFKSTHDQIKRPLRTLDHSYLIGKL